MYETFIVLLFFKSLSSDFFKKINESRWKIDLRFNYEKSTNSFNFIDLFYSFNQEKNTIDFFRIFFLVYETLEM